MWDPLPNKHNHPNNIDSDSSEHNMAKNVGHHY